VQNCPVARLTCGVAQVDVMLPARAVRVTPDGVEDQVCRQDFSWTVALHSPTVRFEVRIRRPGDALRSLGAPPDADVA